VRARSLPFHYGWIVLATTLVALVTTAGFRSAVGVLVTPLHDEFGWSTASISVAAGLNLVVYGFGSVFAAGLYERFGLRRCIVVALALISAGSLLTLAMSAVWQFALLWGLVNGLATGAVGVTLAAVVASRWFVERRGLATGILTAANATGQLVFLPAIAWVTAELGWRWAVGGIALVAVALVLPLVAVLVRDRPSDVGLAAYGATEPDPPAPPREPLLSTVGNGLLIASGSSTFWLLSASFLICGATTNGLIGTHLVPAAVSSGIAEVAAAGLLALIGVFDLVGTICSGWLTDRYDPRKLLFTYYGLRGLSLLALPVVLDGGGAGLVAFVIFYGLDWVATVPPTVALTADTFGRERVGIVFAWIFAAHQIGSGIAAFGAGAAETWLGSYTAAFVGGALLSLLAALIVLRIARPAAPAALAPA
jgi:sugar phosphate permease